MDNEKEKLKEALDYFYKNGLFEKYQWRLKEVKKSYKVFRDSHGNHKLELDTYKWLSGMFGI